MTTRVGVTDPVCAVVDDPRPPTTTTLIPDDATELVVDCSADTDSSASDISDCAAVCEADGDDLDNVDDDGAADPIPYVTTLDAAALAHAERELGETPAVRRAALREMAAWFDANPQVRARRDAQSVLRFLRGQKFRLERAKHKMTMFYRMRAERPEWFAQRDPFAPELAELFDIGCFLPLRTKDAHGRQVFVVRAGASDPKRHKQSDVFKAGKMLVDTVMAEDESVSVYGVVAIFDMRGVTAAHALAVTPAEFRRSVESWQWYPCLNKKLEFVNAPFYVNAFLSAVMWFMSKKLKVRVVVQRGACTVEHAALPPELGGVGESYAQLAEYWKRHVQERSAWFVEDDAFKSVLASKADETKQK